MWRGYTTETFLQQTITNINEKNDTSISNECALKNKFVQYLCRKYRNGNIKSIESDVVHCPNEVCNSTDRKKYSVYISLSKSRANTLQYQKDIALPRGTFQQIKPDIPKPESLSKISLIVFPIFYPPEYHFPPFGNENNGSKSVPPTNARSSFNIAIRQLPRRDPSEVQYMRYKDNRDRLLTYATWETRKPESEYLSQAGFFYTGIADKVRCFSCGVGFTDLAEGTEPIKEHVRYSDQCSYLRILLGENKLEEYKRFLRKEDPEYYRKSKSLETGRVYRHPDYQSLEARKASFTRWPLKFDIDVVADSGLYYTGFEAVVRCFACDGGFRMLKSVDDLWLDHCFFFPSCPHMETRIGKRFINLVQETVLDIEAEEDKEIETIVGQTKGKTCSGIPFGQQKEDHESYMYDALKQLFANGHCQNVGPVLDVLEGQPMKNDQFRSKVEDKLTEKRMWENEKLRKMVYCSECGDNINVVMLPCGHRDYCMKCARKFRCCPKCDRPIKDLRKTYM